MFQTFSDLLQQGRRNIDQLGYEAFPGITPSLKDINRYMYTTFSANRGDLLFSIEGVIPTSVFIRIEPLLRLHGYYYIAMNPLTKVVFMSHLMDPSDFEPTMDYYTTVYDVSPEGGQHPPIYDIARGTIHYLKYDNPTDFSTIRRSSRVYRSSVVPQR